MKIFDCHFHIESGFDNYDINVSNKNVIFNSFNSYIDNMNKLNKSDSISIIFDYINHYDDIDLLLRMKKVNALKIHSRLQKLKHGDYPVLIEHIEALSPQVPIIIDAFYFGDDIDFHPNIKEIIYIAKKFPHLPIVVAHCGGIEVLKYFYYLKSLNNIFFDLSFSLVYLRNTSVFQDYKQLIRFGGINRIMFGTDFPFVSAKSQLDIFLQIIDEINMPDTVREKMLFSNAYDLFVNRDHPIGITNF